MRIDGPAHLLVGLNTDSGQVELSQDVDPPGQPPANIVQRTGLTLDEGRVYFGFGGNAEDCGFYRGRLVSVPESGGTPRFFTVDAGRGESRGGIWMGGAAPAVDANGDLWVSTGNGTPANHFPTPGIGAGLMLATSAQNVIAFHTSAAGAGRGAGATSSAARDNRHHTSPGPATGGRMIAEVVLACLVAVSAFGWLAWLVRRQRRT